jgi:hypothetical protein
LLVSRPWEIKKYIKNAASSQLLGKKIGFSLSAKPTICLVLCHWKLSLSLHETKRHGLSQQHPEI